MSAFAEIEVVGAEDLVKLLLRAGAQAGPAMARLLKEEGDDIMRESQLQVPFRDGPLKSSGRVTGPFGSRTGFEVDLSYGSTAVAYALYQHEGHRQDGSHVIRHYGNGKKGDYLTDPVKAAVPQMSARMALKLQEILGV